MVVRNKPNDETGPESGNLSSKPRTQQVLVTIALFFSVACFAWIGALAENTGDAGHGVVKSAERIERINDASGAICLDMCKIRIDARNTKFHGDLMKRQDLVDLAKIAKEKLIERLRVSYGKYFETIFIGAGKSFSPMSPDGGSMEKLKRKLMIKVLSVQVAIKEQEQDFNGCDCSNGGTALRKDIEHMPAENMQTQIDDTFARYVWATGGHSASAGHGNLYNESYTAVMGRDARMVFEAIGIEFEERNYAMGGTASSAEISMCWEQIFGQDVDFFSWDYGMTDGNHVQRLLHFGYRGGLSTGRPAVLGIRLGGGARAARRGAVLALENLGLAAFEGSEESYKLRNDGIPDSAGMTQSEIEMLPELVRNLKCGDQIEKGEPFCGAEKYSKHVCARRAKQTSWHPGFKSHAMDGHALALFLVDALIDTLQDLANDNSTDFKVLLSDLQQQEKNMYDNFVAKELLNSADSLYLPGDGVEKDSSLDIEAIWKGSSLCRTARTPAQSRYMGFTTNTEKVGNYGILGSETYDTGITIGKARDPDAMGGEMKLVYEPGGKEREACEVVLKPDYKDFFYTNDEHGLTKFIIPNEKEKAAYNYDSGKFKGLIVMVLSACDWGKCQGLREVDYADGQFELTVNDKRVTELEAFGFDAFMMKGDDGLYWQPNNHGDFEIGFRMVKKGGYIKVSAIILY